MSDFSELVDLAAEALGGTVLAANDEFFAPKEALLKPAPAEWREGAYTERGKWMDGWETRRRRTPGFDADVVIWNPEAPVVVDEKTLHHRHPLTPYSGRTLTGSVRGTYVGGVEVFRDGRFAAHTAGRLIHTSEY